MDVKIAEFKNNLSRFLERMVQTGEPITILHRNRPVARVMPIRGKKGQIRSAWISERDELRTKAIRKGVKLQISETAPPALKDIAPVPSLAPDGRTDLQTVAEQRKEKAY